MLKPLLKPFLPPDLSPGFALCKYANLSKFSTNLLFLAHQVGDATRTLNKTIGSVISKITTLHVHHVFLYISLPSLHDCDVKMLNLTFCRGRKQATAKCFLFLNLNKVLRS